MKEQIGRVCVKVAGREATRKCVIIDVIDKNFVVITGPKSLTGIRKRKVNVSHLSFTPYKLDIKPGSSDEQVLQAIKDKGLEDFMKQKVNVRR